MDQLDPKRPFLIQAKANKTIIPSNHLFFDEKIESRARFVQGVNIFVFVHMIYESLRDLYYHVAFKDVCSDYSIMLLIVLITNLIWAIFSFYGFWSISSRKSEKVKIFLYMLLMILVFRIVVYVVMYKSLKTLLITDYRCDAVYQSGFFLMQGIFEGFVILLEFVLVITVVKYVQKWEFNKSLINETYEF